MSTAIEAQNISKSFGNVSVLNNLSYKFEGSKQTVIVGASGSGKSTLLYLLGGLDKATSGEILFEGNPLSNLSDKGLADFRNQNVGFVFQFHFLLSSMNCFQNILLPAKISGRSSREIEDRIRELSEALGVTHCLEKYPFEISGGEQQRINIVRALSLSPKLLLCDEPTGNLDSKNSEKVIELITSLARSFEATLILVTHDQKIASGFESKIVMNDGVIV